MIRVDVLDEASGTAAMIPDRNESCTHAFVQQEYLAIAPLPFTAHSYLPWDMSRPQRQLNTRMLSQQALHQLPAPRLAYCICKARQEA